jgi:hypothetical protein
MDKYSPIPLIKVFDFFSLMLSLLGSGGDAIEHCFW